MYLLIYFQLCWFFMARRLFSSCREWRLLLTEVWGLLTVVASLVTEHGFESEDSAVAAHWLHRSTACGIASDQGLNLRSLLWQADSYPLHHQGSLPLIILLRILTLQLKLPLFFPTMQSQRIIPYFVLHYSISSWMMGRRGGSLGGNGWLNSKGISVFNWAGRKNKTKSKTLRWLPSAALSYLLTTPQLECGVSIWLSGTVYSF